MIPKLNLHHRSASDLQDRRISPHSFWYDPKWIFVNLTAGQPATDSTLDWQVYLPDQSYLTDHKWAGLLDEFRRLVWSLFTAPHNSVRYKPGMASEFGRQVAYFARWMVANGYHSFSELDSFAFDEYVDSVKEDKFADIENPPVATRLLKFLKLPPLIWAQSSELALAGIAPPSDEPYGGASAFSVAKALAEDNRGLIPPIPDHVFIAIMQAAISVLDDIDDIVGAVNSYLSTSAVIETMTEYKRMSTIRSIRKGLEAKYPKASRYLQGTGVWMIKDAVFAASAACSIIIQGCVGLRTAEYCGLEGSPRKDGQPPCVTQRRSVSGLDDIFFISGRVYKGEHGWTEHQWVAGTRPVDSDYVPLPIRAVYALERLFAPFRGDTNSNRLSLYMREAQSFLTPGCALLPLTTDHVRRSQKSFVERFVVGGEWNINPSQWRKTFAQFVIRTDSQMLPALRDQFHHVNIGITEAGYGGADPEYRQVLDDAAVQNSIAFLGALVSERKVVSGTMVDKVRRSAANLRLRFGNRSESEMQGDLKEMVLETGIRVHELRFGGSPAGDCVFRPGTGRCTEGCIARWVMPSPLWSAAQPDACWDCENIIVSPEHVAFWQERWDRHALAYGSAKAVNDMSLANLALRRMAQCAGVLKRLGVSVYLEREDDIYISEK